MSALMGLLPPERTSGGEGGLPQPGKPLASNRLSSPAITREVRLPMYLRPLRGLRQVRSHLAVFCQDRIISHHIDLSATLYSQLVSPLVKEDVDLILPCVGERMSVISNHSGLYWSVAGTDEWPAWLVCRANWRSTLGFGEHSGVMT